LGPGSRFPGPCARIAANSARARYIRRSTAVSARENRSEVLDSRQTSELIDSDQSLRNFLAFSELPLAFLARRFSPTTLRDFYVWSKIKTAGSYCEFKIFLEIKIVFGKDFSQISGKNTGK
jgi:hypothetical protein